MSTQQASPRLSPLPALLANGGSLSKTRGSPLTLPPPSPALSDTGGFAAFDPSPMPASGFNFDRHFALGSEGNQSDDPEEQTSPSKRETELADLNPPPNHHSDAFPPSPSSLMASTSSQIDGLSDYSPSPSVASVRMAQLVTRMPARRALEEPLRLSVAQSMSSSLRLSVVDTDEEEEGTVWDAKRLSRPARPVPVRGATTDLFPVAIKQTAEDCQDSSVVAVPPPAVGTSIHKEDILVKSSSDGSGSSLRGGRDAVLREMAAEEMDPAISPAADAMGRMKSILGPKVKKISAAPWDVDSPSSDSLSAPLRPRARGSMDALRNVASAKFSSKENDKPKSNGRSKSFSLLASRKVSPSEADTKASAAALKGLGLEKVESLTGCVTNAPLPPPIGQSVLDLDDDYAPRKPALTPPLDSPIPFSFPTPPSKPPSPSKARKSFGSSTRARPPPPIHFDMLKTSSAHPPSPSSVPRSAPPHMTTFPAVPRSDSTASLGVHLPRPSTSGSSLANSANSSSPSTPTGQPAVFPSSPTSPTGSYFGSGSVTTSPAGPGYKLISLDEARERESRRIAAAVARRERALTPVEHVVGRDEVLYDGLSRDRTRESTTESSRSRAASGPASSTSTSPSYSPSASSSSLAQQQPTKTLKPKKSGFLRRMMGVDKFNEAPRSDSNTPSPLATSPPYSVTISSPTTSMDLSRSQATATAASVNGLASSPSSASIAPSSRISFLPNPAPNPEHRLRKGLVPSLSLRPISMAFSAGLPSDFLAHVAAADLSSSSNTSPSSPPIPSPSSAQAVNRPTSPVESLVAGSGPSSVQSPFAPSFSSATTGGHSSIFDRDEEHGSTAATTPITPAFPFVSPTSPVFSGGTYAALQDEFARARKVWQHQQWELETQVKVLQAEVEQLRSAQAAQAAECQACGAALKTSPSPSPSIVQRSRFKGHGGSGGLYGSSLAA